MKSKLYTTVCSMVLLLAAFSVNKAYSGGGTIYKPAIVSMITANLMIWTNMGDGDLNRLKVK